MLKTNRRYDIEAAGQRCAGGARPWQPCRFRQPRRKIFTSRPPTRTSSAGTIHSSIRKREDLSIIWEDLGRVKLKAADLVTNTRSSRSARSSTSNGTTMSTS